MMSTALDDGNILQHQIIKKGAKFYRKEQRRKER